MDTERLHTDIKSQLRDDPVSVEHLDSQADPRWTPRSRWVTQTFRTHICPGFQLTPSCSSVLAQPSPCRTLWSVQDPLPGSPQLLLAWTPDLCQKLLQIVHHLFLHQTRAPQTIRASQAASHSREAMEFHLHGFHRQTTRVFWLYVYPSR